MAVVFFGTPSQMGRRDKRRKFEAKRRISAGRIHFARGLKASGSPTGASRMGRHDHAMDEIRYFAATVADRGSGQFYVGSVERSAF